MKKFIIFFICVPFVYSGMHSLITTYTEISGQTAAGTPEFSAVTTLDDHQIDYYDSNIKKLIPRQDWIKEFASTPMWQEYTDIREKQQQIYRNNTHVIMERFNQTHGVHVYQRRYGCEWDDETGDSHGFDRYSYDGEDFISLDLKENRYTASVPRASPTVMWNNDREQQKFLKQYLRYECVYWLKELLVLRKADLERRAPEVSLLRKDPSSPVVCHATGFYPSGVTLTWLRNGVNHYKDVDLGDLLPNEDRTFQRRSSLRVSPDEWESDQFTCEVEHQGKTIEKILTDQEIKSNYRPTNPYLITLLCVIAIVLLIGAVFCIQSKKPKHEPVSRESEEHIFIDKAL